MFSWFKKDETAADLYIDLGTANTLISARGVGIVVNEPSVVAYTEISPGKRKTLAVGKEALAQLAKTPGNIRSMKPVRDGVIADFELTEVMLRFFLNYPRVKGQFSKPRMVVSLPYGVTEVEKKAVIETCMKAGAKKVFLIDEPMAAAIGAGVPIRSPKGHMIIDIGGGTTEIAIIALADIVFCETIRVGGHKIDESIVSYLKTYKKIIISETTAEEIKIAIGTAVPKKGVRTAMVSGRHAETGLHVTMEITSEEVGQAMNDRIQDIILGIHRALEQTPPELVSDIIDNGVVLAGGGALIRDLDLRIRNEVRLDVRVADNPLVAIAKGGEVVLNDPQLLEKVQLAL